jgi:hypothetical protein
MGAYRDFLALLRDAHAIVDDIHVVAEQSISGILRNYAEGYQKHEPISVAFSFQEIRIITGLSVFELKPQCLFDFTELELHCRILSVAIRMVFGKSSQCLLISFLGDMPTRRLGYP